MDKEEHQDQVQREASAAGLLVGVLFLFLACVTIIVGLYFGLQFNLHLLRHCRKLAVTRAHACGTGLSCCAPDLALRASILSR